MHSLNLVFISKLQKKCKNIIKILVFFLFLVHLLRTQDLSGFKEKYLCFTVAKLIPTTSSIHITSWKNTFAPFSQFAVLSHSGLDAPK